jgi:hypothetical protein
MSPAAVPNWSTFSSQSIFVLGASIDGTRRALHMRRCRPCDSVARAQPGGQARRELHCADRPRHGHVEQTDLFGAQLGRRVHRIEEVVEQFDLFPFESPWPWRDGPS